MIEITNKMYISLMIPFIISTVTQPLLGAVDIAVIGRVGNENSIAGIAIGSLIFNTLYWMFGFLRVSVTGYSAQSAYKSIEESSLTFLRPIFMAILISIIFILFQKLLFSTSMMFINPISEVRAVTSIYYKILIYGAPFVLFNYVILGWLMGQGNIKGSLTMQISGNVLNIILDILFVLILKYEVKGVAIATLISQILSTIIGLYFIIPYGYFKYFDLKKIVKKREILEIISVNKNLMIRTFCLLLHNNMIMEASSKLGVDILAGNSVLLQILSIISYSFDGIANASSVFAGRAKGLKNNLLMKDVLRKNLYWGFVFVVLTTGLYMSLSKNIISLFTNVDTVLLTANTYRMWVGLYPIVAFLGLTYYGIFTGTNKTLPIATSTIVAFILFAISWKFMIPIFGNNGVWISLLVFYFFRGILLVMQLRKTLC